MTKKRKSTGPLLVSAPDVSHENDYSYVLKEAAALAEERGAQYGSSEKNFESIQSLLKDMFGLDLSVEEIVKVMIAVKFSREKNKHKADNLIDIVNYVAMLYHFLPHETHPR